jgi:hypothetical protein
MSLSITKFEGTVAVGDSNYTFACNGSGLIFDVDHTGAMLILNSFSDSDTIEAFIETPTVTTTTDLDSVVEAQNEETLPVPKKKRGRPRKKKVADIEAAAEIVVETSTENDEETVVSECSFDSEKLDLPDEIKNARQLKGIVSYFVDLGITKAETIAVECEKYREIVPLLSRATKLEERIERILVLIGVANDD